MKKINIDRIQDGMILTREVYGSSGSILLGKGIKLTQTIGRRLKNWGVSIVYIQGDEEDIKNDKSVEKSPAIADESLKVKFGDVLENPYMKDIFHAVYEYKRKKYDKG